MNPEATETLDLTGVPCPANTARAILTLEFMDPGERLLLIIDDGEPYENVPDSLEIEGHTVISQDQSGHSWMLLVERGEE